jgi:hypothetical protein
MSFVTNKRCMGPIWTKSNSSHNVWLGNSQCQISWQSTGSKHTDQSDSGIVKWAQFMAFVWKNNEIADAHTRITSGRPKSQTIYLLINYYSHLESCTLTVWRGGGKPTWTNHSPTTVETSKFASTKCQDVLQRKEPSGDSLAKDTLETPLASSER